MSELLRLAELCEKATAPDRELDLAISVAINFKGVFNEDRQWKWSAGGDEIAGYKEGKLYAFLDPAQFVPRWTRSIDAAMTLGDPAAEISISTLYGVARVEYPLNFADHESYKGEHVGGLIAPAICAAIVRAIDGAASLRASDTAGVR